ILLPSSPTTKIIGFIHHTSFLNSTDAPIQTSEYQSIRVSEYHFIGCLTKAVSTSQAGNDKKDHLIERLGRELDKRI
ncbi:MAG: hypothetical protein AAGK05_11105, partial [Pseudomonadota bacterium]